MSQLFSTDLIPIPDRLDAWLSNARQICGNCQFHFNKHYPFHGSIERRKVGNLEFTLFSSSALSFDKIPQGDLQPERRVYIVISQLAGVRQYSQAGKLTTLSKGDTTLIDAGVPWSSSCAGDCARLYLRVPRLLMERSLRSIQIPFAREYPAQVDWERRSSTWRLHSITMQKSLVQKRVQRHRCLPERSVRVPQRIGTGNEKRP